MAENWIDSATEFSSDSLAGTVGNSVVYNTGTVSLNLKATIGTTSREIVDANGAGVIWTSTDFIVRSKRLKASGAVFLPAKGHTITRTVGTVVETYTVLLVPGGDCYQKEDQYGNLFRIHTKLTASV